MVKSGKNFSFPLKKAVILRGITAFLKFAYRQASLEFEIWNLESGIWNLKFPYFKTSTEGDTSCFLYESKRLAQRI